MMPNLDPYYKKRKGVLSVSVRADEAYKVIEQLSPSDRKTVYDLAQFLRARHHAVVKAWQDIDAQEPDFEPLSSEEAEQLRDYEFAPWNR